MSFIGIANNIWKDIKGTGGSGGGVTQVGNDANTKILLHCDGANLSTTVPDTNAGGLPKTWVCTDTAALSTAQPKFGASSLFIAVDNAHTACLRTPDNTDFNLAGSDFTVDCWFRVNAGAIPAGQCPVFTFGVIAPKSLGAILNDTTYRKMSSFIRLDTGSFSWEGTISIADNSGWHHYALVRSGNTFMMFIDGIKDGVDQVQAGNLVNPGTLPFMIGNYGDNTPTGNFSISWPGYITEFRMSNVARWTANFTPSTVAYGPG